MVNRAFTAFSVSFESTQEKLAHMAYCFLVGEMRDSVNSYLKAASSTKVRSLAEIIQFNKDNPGLQAGISKTSDHGRVLLTNLIF